MNLDYLRFGKLIDLTLKQIQNNKQRLSNIVNYPKTQEHVLNSLCRVLGINAPEATNNPKIASGYIRGNKEFDAEYHRNIIESQPSQFIAACQERLQIEFPDDIYFSKQALCQDILNQLEKPEQALCRYHPFHQTIIDFFGSEDVGTEFKELLKSDLNDENYDHFLALTIYFLAAFVYNKKEIPQNVEQLIKNAENITKQSIDAIIEGRYYKSFKRHYEFFPIKDERIIEVRTTTTFTSSWLSPALKIKSGFYRIKRDFSTEKMRDNHRLEYIIINDIKYEGDAIKTYFEETDNQNFPYIKKYEIENVPYAEEYTIKYFIKSKRDIFYLQTAAKVQLPTLYYELIGKVIGSQAQNYILNFRAFTPYKQVSDEDITLQRQYGGNNFTFIVPKLVTNHSGYSLNIRPKSDALLNYFSTEDLKAELERRELEANIYQD